MAIAQTQKATGVSTGDTSTATLGSTPTNGNTLIAVHFANATPTTPAGWTQVRQRNFGTSRYLTAYRKNAGGSEPTGLTVTATGASLQDLHLYEYSGLATAPDDQGVDNASGGATSLSTGTTGTTAQADELLMAAVAGIAALNGVNSYTNSFAEQADTARMGSGDRIVSATGTFDTTIAWTTSRSVATMLVTFKGAAAGTSLTVADGAHAHAADGVTVTQVHILVVADSGHGHVADNVSLTQVHALVVADATHAHPADSVSLTQVHVLTVADATHGHTADNLALASGGDLGVAEASHAHTVDSPSLTQQHQLVAADASHAHTADEVAVTQVHVLAVSDGSHAHTADGPTLTQTHVLVVAEGAHGHLTDIVVLEAGGAIVNATSTSTVAAGSSTSTVAGGSSVSTVSRAATSVSTVSDG